MFQATVAMVQLTLKLSHLQSEGFSSCWLLSPSDMTLINGHWYLFYFWYEMMFQAHLVVCLPRNELLDFS